MAWLLVILLLALAASTKAQNYTENGPYTSSQTDWQHTVPPENINGRSYTLDLKIVYPADVNENTECPVVFFYHGFEMSSAGYEPYAERLASWGYVVVMYNVPGHFFGLPLPWQQIINDKTEITFFTDILNAVRNQIPQQSWPKNMDFNSVVVGGHSRGGKLAGLIAAEHPHVKAMFLIDPVDGDGRHTGEDYPSAVKALKGRNFSMVIVGSSVSGRCNPSDYDYCCFWNVSGDGSWLAVIAGAGHAQFLKASWMQRGWNFLCSGGNTPTETVISTTMPFLVAWLESTFKPRPNVDERDEMSPLNNFFAWVKSEQHAGRLNFTIKSDEVADDSTCNKECKPLEEAPSATKDHNTVEL